MEHYLNEYKKHLLSFKCTEDIRQKVWLKDLLEKIPDEKLSSMRFICSAENLNNAIRYFTKFQAKMELKFNKYEE
eukprot:snap_masked-scaffold_64-processed-gene-0.29-mRNA-1 protein AED:1.00 eAED:1.00 QI:0/-1/0/0/-1/1/1/0/74